MNLPRTLFWSGLALLAALWLGSVGSAFSNGGLGAADEHETSGGAGDAVRDLAPFEKIVDRGSVDVEVSVGSEQRVEVVADDDQASRVETWVDDGTLYISNRDSLWTHGGLKVKVVVPQLEALTLAGSGDGSVEGLDARNLEIRTEGSGDVTASGRAARLTYSGAGSGDADLSDLEAAEATVRLHGSGDARVNVTGALDVETFGSGDVSYSGKPSHISQSTHGSGDVSAD
jgi:hypothetical protein